MPDAPDPVARLREWIADRDRTNQDGLVCLSDARQLLAAFEALQRDGDALAEAADPESELEGEYETTGARRLAIAAALAAWQSRKETNHDAP